MKKPYLFSLLGLALLTAFALSFPALYFGRADSQTFSALRLEKVERQDIKGMVFSSATTEQILTMMGDMQYTQLIDREAPDGKDLISRCLKSYIQQEPDYFGAYFSQRILKDWDAWELDAFSYQAGVGIFDGAICTSTLCEASLIHRDEGLHFSCRFDPDSLKLYAFYLYDPFWTDETPDSLRQELELDLGLYVFLTQYLALDPDGTGLPKDSGTDYYGKFYPAGHFLPDPRRAPVLYFGPAQVLWDGSNLQVNCYLWH